LEFKQELPRRLSTGQRETIKIVRILSRTQTGKGIPTRTLCQKDQGTVKIEQKPVTTGDRTTQGYCHLKGHLFKKGLTNSPTCERCLEKDESATHIPCDCEAIAYLRFRHLGHYIMEHGDYQDAPVSKILYFIRSVGLK
jgi:hypothetical protein